MTFHKIKGCLWGNLGKMQLGLALGSVKLAALVIREIALKL